MRVKRASCWLLENGDLDHDPPDEGRVGVGGGHTTAAPGAGSPVRLDASSLRLICIFCMLCMKHIII